MKNSKIRRRLLALSMLPLAWALTAPAARAGTIALDFDSVSVPGVLIDATAYLSAFGITFNALTPNTTASILNSLDSNSAAIATSSPNVFGVSAPVGPAAVSYELRFSTPLDSLSFTRTGIISTRSVSEIERTAPG